MVRDALHLGLIKKQDCCLCGNTESEAHHDDYQKPNRISWLCNVHHKQVHWRLGWGVRNGSDDYYIDMFAPSKELPFGCTRFGEFTRWKEEIQAIAIHNKESELLWLLKNFGCVKLCGLYTNAPKTLQQIYTSAIEKFQLNSTTYGTLLIINSAKSSAGGQVEIKAETAPKSQIVGTFTSILPSTANLAADDSPSSPPVTESRHEVSYTHKKPKKS